MKQEPSNEYNTRVSEWLSAHGIAYTITRIGAERGFNGDTSDKLMHDTYMAAFSRTHTGNRHQKPVTDSLVVPKFYQSAVHSESAIKEAKCTDKKCGVQYGETMMHQRGCNAPKPADAEIPSAYTILDCLTLSDPGTFSDFCSDFGYDEDSRKAERTYFACQDEWKRVRAFFTAEELSELQEIAS